MHGGSSCLFTYRVIKHGLSLINQTRRHTLARPTRPLWSCVFMSAYVPRVCSLQARLQHHYGSSAWNRAAITCNLLFRHQIVLKVKPVWNDIKQHIVDEGARVCLCFLVHNSPFYYPEELKPCRVFQITHFRTKYFECVSAFTLRDMLKNNQNGLKIGCGTMDGTHLRQTPYSSKSTESFLNFLEKVSVLFHQAPLFTYTVV